MVLEKTLENPLPCKEIQQVHSRGNQSWIFFERNDAEAETPIPWPPDGKNWLIWKRSWCWGRSKAVGEGDNREWDGWMASPTQWVWVWASSGSWWWTGRPVDPGDPREVHGVEKSQTRLRGWMKTTNPLWRVNFVCLCTIKVAFLTSKWKLVNIFWAFPQPEYHRLSPWLRSQLSHLLLLMTFLWPQFSSSGKGKN